MNRTVIPVDAPERLFVLPWGTVESTSDDFVVDRESAAAIVTRFKEHGAKLPIDFEHSTIGTEIPKYKTPDGSAPAMGWIEELEVVEGDGIYGQVVWTERGERFVRSKEYRYLSPVTYNRPSDNKAMLLHSVALTNKPAIRNMRPIVNQESPMIDDDMWERLSYFLNVPLTSTKETIMQELQKLLAQLRELAGAAETADQAAVVSALKQRLDAGKSLRAAVCKAADVGDGEKDDALVAAVNKLKAAPPSPSPAGDTVPKAELDAVVTAHTQTVEKLTALEARLADRESAERIDAAMRAGKLTEAMLSPHSDGSNYFRKLARDGAAWDAWLERQPVIAPPAGRVVAHRAGGGPAAANAAQRWETLVAEKVKAGLSRGAAVLAVNREQPGLREQFVEQHNAQVRRSA